MDTETSWDNVTKHELFTCHKFTLKIVSFAIFCFELFTMRFVHWILGKVKFKKKLLYMWSVLHSRKLANLRMRNKKMSTQTALSSSPLARTASAAACSRSASESTSPTSHKQKYAWYSTFRICGRSAWHSHKSVQRSVLKLIRVAIRPYF